MFESTSEILRQFGIFAGIGFFLGLGYDIFRFFRIVTGSGRLAVNIGDLIYLPVCAFILFCCIVEYGGGKLRMYFFSGAILGAVVYLFTLGLLTKFIAKCARRFILFIVDLIKRPVFRCYRSFQQLFKKIFGGMCQKISNGVKSTRLLLKKKVKKVYNKNNTKMDKLYKKGGEERYVIKAEVRKKA